MTATWPSSRIEVHAQLVDRLLLLGVADGQLLGREAGGVGQGRERALERAVVDLGDQPQRDGVRAVVPGVSRKYPLASL